MHNTVYDGYHVGKRSHPMSHIAVMNKLLQKWGGESDFCE